MNLVKYETYSEKEVKAVTALVPSSQAFVLALMETKVSVMSPRESDQYVYDVLKLSEIDSGLTKVDNKDLIKLAEDVKELLLDRYPTITKSEFRIACKNGVLEMYGQWFGMCLKSVNQWLKGYMAGEGRIKAIKEWNAQIEKSETSDVPIKAKEFFSKAACMKAFESYKKDREIAFPFAYYDIINDLVGVPFKAGYKNKTLVADPEVRKRIIAEVTESHTNGLLKEKLKQEKRGNHVSAEALMSIITADFKNTKSLENLIKGEFLKHYFDSLITENKQLKL
jgi:hypothetical protein